MKKLLALLVIAAGVVAPPARADLCQLSSPPPFHRIGLEYERQIAWTGLPSNPEYPPCLTQLYRRLPHLGLSVEAREAALSTYARAIALGLRHGLYLAESPSPRIDPTNPYVRDLRHLVTLSRDLRVPAGVRNLRIYADAYAADLAAPVARALDELVERVWRLVGDDARDGELIRTDLRVLAYVNTPEARRRLGTARHDHRPAVRQLARFLRRRPPCEAELAE